MLIGVNRSAEIHYAETLTAGLLLKAQFGLFAADIFAVVELVHLELHSTFTKRLCLHGEVLRTLPLFLMQGLFFQFVCNGSCCIHTTSAYHLNISDIRVANATFAYVTHA